MKLSKVIAILVISQLIVTMAMAQTIKLKKDAAKPADKNARAAAIATPSGTVQILTKGDGIPVEKTSPAGTEGESQPNPPVQSPPRPLAKVEQQENTLTRTLDGVTIIQPKQFPDTVLLAGSLYVSDTEIGFIALGQSGELTHRRLILTPIRNSTETKLIYRTAQQVDFPVRALEGREIWDDLQLQKVLRRNSVRKDCPATITIENTGSELILKSIKFECAPNVVQGYNLNFG